MAAVASLAVVIMGVFKPLYIKTVRAAGRRAGWRILLAAGFLAVPTLAGAEEERGTLSVNIENDKVANTDRHYTNGLRLSYLAGANEAPDRLLELARDIPIFIRGGDIRVGYSAGQSIFTPEQTGTRELVEDDRPYAGWLYGGLALLNDSGKAVQALALDVGLIGPYAFGEDTQNTWHEVIQVDRANGWDNQLKTEPGVALSYEHKLRHVVEFTSNGLGVDVMPHVGATLGNVFTYGAAGGTVRIGENLPNDYGPPRIRPSLPGSSFFTNSDGFGWYLFAGIEGRAVVHNIFLDGNHFTDSQSVDRELFVGDIQAGAAITVDRFRLAYSHVFRSKEFAEQGQSDRFGAVSLSVKF